MRTIQITIDEKLLAAFDADREVQQIGRSAVLRALASEYLDRRRREVIANQYAKAYGGGSGQSDELAGWESEGAWPEE